jgi:hypothetical protein
LQKIIKYDIYGYQHFQLNAMKKETHKTNSPMDTPVSSQKGQSQRKNKPEQRLNLLFAQLEINMEESIKALSPRQTVKLWIDLTRLSVPKLKRIHWQPDPIEESENKVIFEFVNSDEISMKIRI